MRAFTGHVQAMGASGSSRPEPHELLDQPDLLGLSNEQFQHQE
jgi:hypothetical protein